MLHARKKKLTVCVCVVLRLILVLVWKNYLGFSVGYVLCASPYSSTSIMSSKGPSYRVEKNLFSEDQKSKLGFDWSECQHATHGDFDISEILFSAKKSWGTFS